MLEPAGVDRADGRGRAALRRRFDDVRDRAKEGDVRVVN
jgi:hypothetical protein